MNYELKIYLVVLCSLLALTSCFKDETTNADKPLSEIILKEGSIDYTYNIEKNQVLTISPEFYQTNQDKEVTYTWEVDQKVYSHEKDFVYTGNELGTFQCRLILSNEDGKTFFPFVLNVNSPYEEGLTVLSVDPEGKSRLSFMLSPTDTTQETYFLDEECFSKNNPDTRFADNAIDMVQSSGSLIIACQGKENTSDVPTIYYLNDKTLTVENILTVPEYADFMPTRLAIPSISSSGAQYPVICRNGNAYEFSTTEGALAKPTKLQSNYSQSVVIDDSGSGYYFTLVFWDKTIGGLCELYNGYGPYYCSETYHVVRDGCTGTDNYFDGKQFICMVKSELTTAQRAIEEPNIIVLVKVGTLIQRVVLNVNFWVYNYDTLENVLSDNGGFRMCGVGNCPVDENTPMIASRTYYSVLFGKGNKVMRWNYTTSQLINNADVLASVGSDNAVVTGFTLSSDQTRTYVSFYEPDQPGLNGSVWVIDTDKGTVLKQYNNICYKPVKMIYKKK